MNNTRYKGIFSGEQEGIKPLNFAPMVDFLFLMLTTMTILMVLQPVPPKTLEASLAKEGSKMGGISPNTQAVLFDLSPDGFCQYKLPSGTFIGLSSAEVAPFIQKKLILSPDTIFLRVAEATSWTTLSEVMVALQASGYKVHLLLKNNGQGQNERSQGEKK